MIGDFQVVAYHRIAAYKTMLTHADLSVDTGSSRNMAKGSDPGFVFNQGFAVDDAAMSYMGAAVDQGMMHNNAALVELRTGTDVSMRTDDDGQVPAGQLYSFVNFPTAGCRPDLPQGDQEIRTIFGQTGYIVVVAHYRIAQHKAAPFFGQVNDAGDAVLAALLNDIDARKAMASAPNQ